MKAFMLTRFRTPARALLLAALSACWLPQARAQVTLYTDEASFNAASANLNFVLTTFEGIAPAGGNVHNPDLSPLTVVYEDAYNAYARYDDVYDATAARGFLTLNGSANLVIPDDGVNLPTTVFALHGSISGSLGGDPVTAFGTEVGFRDHYGGSNSSAGVNDFPLTDKLDVQLYNDGIPIGGVFHLDSFATGYVGFVSAVPFNRVAFTTVSRSLPYINGYPVPDPYCQVYDNVRFGAGPTLPTVTVVGDSPDADAATGQAGAFVLTLSAPAATDLKVAYTVKGSAANGTDYALLKGTVKVKAGKTSKSLAVIPQGAPGGGAKKVVKLTLQPGTGYLIGTPGPVKVKISETK